MRLSFTSSNWSLPIFWAQEFILESTCSQNYKIGCLAFSEEKCECHFKVNGGPDPPTLVQQGGWGHPPPNSGAVWVRVFQPTATQKVLTLKKNGQKCHFGHFRGQKVCHKCKKKFQRTAKTKSCFPFVSETENLSFWGESWAPLGSEGRGDTPT